MELHVYCPLAGSPTLDAACLAIVWLAELSSQDIKVYPSNNTHLSPTGALPVLIGTQEPVVHGFPEIAVRLIGRDLTPVETALICYCQQLTVITEWNLFVLQDNYEGLTRPEISAAIPFPMQYNAALALHRKAASQQPPSKKKSKDEKGINKLHTAILEQSKDMEKARETPRETLNRMMHITSLFDTIVPFLKGLENESPAALFVAANLVLLTLPRLPAQPLGYIIEENEELKRLRDYGRSLNFRTTKYIPAVPADRAYSLWNTVSAHFQFLRGTWSPL